MSVYGSPMARPSRIEYPGALYHVRARGNRGRPIFADDLDRLRFLATLAEACEKTDWRIHAYGLTGNHYHLLVETPERNLVAGMKWLQGSYTQGYNSRHEEPQSETGAAKTPVAPGGGS